MFDSRKEGKIEAEKVRTILNTLGHTYDDQELEALLESEDGEGNPFFFILINYHVDEKRLCSFSLFFFIILKFTTLLYYLSRSI